MTVGIVGSGAEATARMEALRALPEETDVRLLDAVPDFAAVLEAGAGALPDVLDTFLDGVEAVFVAVPTSQRYQVAAAAAKRGRHVFLEWPPATSARECEAVVHLAEEAGVEAAVSRPLRFQPDVRSLSPTARADLIVLRQTLQAKEELPWPRHLADAVDLCCALARSHSVQRVDAEMVRGPAAQPEAVAFGLRFHSGTYAQASLRRGALASLTHLYAAGPGSTLDADLDTPCPILIQTETQAFLQALQQQHPVPVTALDGLYAMRLLERIMERLR
ncbi:MAG: Gfo/Idh/MocA family protein [Rhodothermales bacterium]